MDQDRVRVRDRVRNRNRHRHIYRRSSWSSSSSSSRLCNLPKIFIPPTDKIIAIACEDGVEAATIMNNYHYTHHHRRPQSKHLYVSTTTTTSADSGCPKKAILNVNGCDNGNGNCLSDGSGSLWIAVAHSSKCNGDRKCVINKTLPLSISSQALEQSPLETLTDSDRLDAADISLSAADDRFITDPDFRGLLTEQQRQLASIINNQRQTNPNNQEPPKQKLIASYFSETCRKNNYDWRTEFVDRIDIDMNIDHSAEEDVESENEFGDPATNDQTGEQRPTDHCASDAQKGESKRVIVAMDPHRIDSTADMSSAQATCQTLLEANTSDKTAAMKDANSSRRKSSVLWSANDEICIESDSSQTRRTGRRQFRQLLNYMPSFSTTLSTSLGDRSSSAFSDGFEVASGTSRIKFATRGLQGNGRVRNRRRDTESNSFRNLKLLIKRNLVATLVGAYILFSIIFMVALMVPYFYRVANNNNGNPVKAGTIDEGLLESESASQVMDEVARNLSAVISNRSSHEEGHHQSAATRHSQAISTGSHQQAHGLASISQVSTTTTMSADDRPDTSDARTKLANKLVSVGTQTDPANETSAEDEEEAKYKRWFNTTFESNLRGRDVNLTELWDVTFKAQCQPIEIPFCTHRLELSSGQHGAAPIKVKFPYTSTLLPNHLTSYDQSDVDYRLEKYLPLIDVRCYALMQIFICSIHVPKCVQVEANSTHLLGISPESGKTITTPVTFDGLTFNPSSIRNSSIHRLESKSQSAPAPDSDTDTDGQGSSRVGQFISSLLPKLGPNGQKLTKAPKLARLIPPCRSVCKEALRRCGFFLEVQSISLFDFEQCDSLPESTDENVCVGLHEHKQLQKLVEKQSHSCDENEFRCASGGECIPKKWRCDGFSDCRDKSDEKQCSLCDASTQFYCGSDHCIHKSQVCNGRVDCRDGRDERRCFRLADSIDKSVTDLRSLGTSNAVSGQLRKLEAWNAMEDVWVPVCAAHWAADQMSDQTCNMLGYRRAIGSARLLNYAGGGTDVFMDDVPGQQDQDTTTTTTTTTPRALPMSGIKGSVIPDRLRAQFNQARFDDEMSYRAATNRSLLLNEVNASNKTAIKKVSSLVELLRLGPQTGCSKDTYVSSTVYLSCVEFECGRPAVSHLARYNFARSAAAVTEPTIVPNSTQLSVHRYPGANSSDPIPSSRGIMGLVHPGVPQRRQMLEKSEELLGDLAFMKHAMSHPDYPISSRVVGGYESMPGEFPYLAALHGGPNEVFFCGGVLIGRRWLMTAAHCIGNRTRHDGWMVKVGVTRRIASPAFLKKLRVSEIIKHPEFNHGQMLSNDIAIIKLAESVEFNEYLRPICLPEPGVVLGPDNSRDCVVVGFGKSQYSRDANYLQVAHFASVPIVEPSVCKEWYADHGMNLTDGMLCAGYSEGKHDACQGDSGSGLFCRSSDKNQFFLAGIVSFGINCATPRLPGVYTSVPKYVKWIESTIRQRVHPL